MPLPGTGDHAANKATLQEDLSPRNRHGPPETDAAAAALGRVDPVRDQLLAGKGRAALLLDVRLVFIAEVAEGAEEGVGRGAAEVAERSRRRGDPRSGQPATA